MAAARGIDYIPYTADDGLRNGGVGELGLLVKGVLLGNAGVGKRHFSYRLRFDEWGNGTCPCSVGTDFSIKRVTSSGSRLQNDVELQIWWTAGQERFGALHPALTRGLVVWYLCFEHRPTLDLSDAESTTSHCRDAQVEPWFQYLTTASALYSAPVLPVLLGLKSAVLRRSATRRGLKDVEEDDGIENFNRQLCAMASRAICSAIHIPELFHTLRCFHVSSKTNEGIEELLHYTADTIRGIVHRFPRGVSSTYPSGCRAGGVKLPLPKEVPPSAESSTRCSSS